MAQPSPRWGPKGNGAQTASSFVFWVSAGTWGSLKNGRQVGMASPGQRKEHRAWSQGDPSLSAGSATSGTVTVGKPCSLAGHPLSCLQRKRALTLKRGVCPLESWEREPRLSSQGASSSLSSPSSERSQWRGKQGSIPASKEQSRGPGGRGAEGALHGLPCSVVACEEGRRTGRGPRRPSTGQLPGSLGAVHRWGARGENPAHGHEFAR